MAGFFFCLASAEGAGLLFCPAAIHPRTSVYSVFCAINAVYTANVTKQHTGLCRGFSRYFPHSTAYNTRQTKADITPPATRWSASHRCSASSTSRYHRHAGTLCRPAQTAYYNNVYKGAPLPPVMDSCQTVQHITDHTSPAGSAPTVCGSLASAAPGAPAEGSASPPVQGQPGGLHPAGQSSGKGAAGGAEQLAACCRISFRAFAR